MYPGAALRKCYECNCVGNDGASGDVSVPVFRCADHYNEGTAHTPVLARVAIVSRAHYSTARYNAAPIARLRCRVRMVLRHGGRAMRECEPAHANQFPSAQREHPRGLEELHRPVLVHARWEERERPCGRGGLLDAPDWVR